MPNYNAKENSNNWGGEGPESAGRKGGLMKGENAKKRMEEVRRRMEKENEEESRLEELSEEPTE